MPTSKRVRDADTLATLIPFRSRHAGVAQHPSVRPPEPSPPSATDDLHTRPHQAPEQLSLFGEDLHR